MIDKNFMYPISSIKDIEDSLEKVLELKYGRYSIENISDLEEGNPIEIEIWDSENNNSFFIPIDKKINQILTIYDIPVMFSVSFFEEYKNSWRL
jgi:hypothetical protein